MANFKAFVSTNVCHTTLFLVGTPFKIINSSGSGKANLSWISDKVSNVLFRGKGRKNMVPLQAWRHYKLAHCQNMYQTARLSEKLLLAKLTAYSKHQVISAHLVQVQ